jgi:hypothetical protein
MAKNDTENRKHKREIVHLATVMVGIERKDKVKCATFDISEGGVKVLTDSELLSSNYEIKLGKMKIFGKVVYKEKRASQIMENPSFYYGFKFVKPITGDMKNQMILSTPQRGK